jgi:putative lipoic acid-binding regulatory protein
MKKIISMLILACMFSIAAFAQKATTTVRASGAAHFAVVTTNDKVFTEAVKHFEPIVVRYTVSYKTDRLGRYKEVTIYFANEDRDKVDVWLKQFAG